MFVNKNQSAYGDVKLYYDFINNKKWEMIFLDFGFVTPAIWMVWHSPYDYKISMTRDSMWHLYVSIIFLEISLLTLSVGVGLKLPPFN